MTHKQESGRTVLETIAVLTIVAVLLITSIGGIAFLIQRNNRKQSTKEVASMVTAISTSNVLRKYDKGKQIPVREVVQGPKASDGYNQVMILSEGEDSYMVVTSLGNNAAISALQVQPGTCSEVLNAFNNQQASIFVDTEVERATSAKDFLDKTNLSEKKTQMKLEHFTTTDDLDPTLIDACNESGLFYVATGTEARYLTGDTLTRCPLYTAANGQLLEEKEDKDGECCASFGCGDLCGCKGTCVDNKYCGCTTNDDCYKYQTCDKSPNQPVGQCVSVECNTDSDCRTGEYCENFQCLSCQDHAVFNSTTRTCECKAGFTLNPTTNECVSCYDSIPDDNTNTTNIDEGCTADKPYCQKGSCVTCYDSISDDDTTTTNTDMGCNAGKPYCKNGSCVACQKTLNTPHLGCGEDAPLCDNGQCAVCYPDETKLIDPGCTQKMPTCKNGKCQACETDADCPTSKPAEKDGAYYCEEGQCKKCDNSTPFRAEDACWACHNTEEGEVKDEGCHEYEKPFCVVEEGKNYGSKCGECTENTHCDFNPNEECNLEKENQEKNTCICIDGYKRDENGKCVQCTQSSDCDVHDFCVTDKNDEYYGTCRPCSTEDETAARPTKDSETCSCPEGMRPFFSSTRATRKGGNGGSWTCAVGCSQHIHCPENECCSCTGSECKEPGTCSGTDANGHKWYRPQTSNEACTACKPCEKYDAETNQCVANCEKGEACVPLAGGGFDPNNANLEEVCGGWACVTMEADLISFKGRLNDRDFYIPPAASNYRMTHAAASRFCEYHGLKLASLAEACDKDYAYDSGHDCPNITLNQSFTHYGKTYQLGAWHVSDHGSFWLADISTNNALRVTWSCGNNHMANMCYSFYPLCTNK